MVLKNDRTQKIIDLIDKFGCADATHVSRLFYNYPYGIINARKKLTDLTKEGTLKRKRNDINSKYIYFRKEPAQVQHKLIVLEFYVLSVLKYGNVSCELEYTGFPGVRPDAYLKGGKNRLLEVHLSNNELNLEKYLYPSRSIANFPEIVVVTNRKVNIPSEVNTKLKVIVTSIEKMGEKV